MTPKRGNRFSENIMPPMKWKIGRVTVTQIIELDLTGGTRFILPQASREEVRKHAWLTPDFADAEGRLRMTIHAFVLETPTRRIVVDTGLGNDKENRPIPTWNRLNGPFLNDLTAAGYPPESIDMVLCTHLHVDHVGWNTRLVDGRWVPTFPNARYVMGRVEFEHWKQQHALGRSIVFADSVQPVAEAGLVDLVESDAVLSDEISLIPTPGHSPGHMSVHLKSDGAQALLLGDAAHHPCQMAHIDWSSTADSDPVQSARTRHDLFERFIEIPAIVLAGHFVGGRIVRDGKAYRLDR